MENKITLNIAEAAQVIGVSVPVMRKLAQRPDFPSIRAGRRWIIPEKSFKEWIEVQAHERRVIS